MFLWAGLLIVSAVAFGALEFGQEKRLHPVLHGATMLAFVYGIILLTGAAEGHDNPFNPLRVAYASSAPAAKRPPSSLFTYVDTLPKLQSKVAAAHKAGKPVMIEFFATWCPFCRKVDTDVLSDDGIRKQMKKFVTLRVDVSERNPKLARMMEAYNVYGVPTMVFFDKNGELYQADELRSGITRYSLSAVLDKLS